MALSSSRFCKIISDTFGPSSWRRVWARAASRSCGGVETPAPAPCPPRPPPPCRPPPPSAARYADQVVCCPPPQGRRPPCPPQPRPRPLTCATQLQRDRSSGVHRDVCGEGEGEGGCGGGQDRVARRLAAAEAARRADYESEVRCGAADRAPRSAPLSISAERHCARATDGRVYTLPCAPAPPPPCGPCREPPPPRTHDLQPDDACHVNTERYVDPCAHRPRTFVEIARGNTGSKSAAPARGGGCPRPRGLHTSAPAPRGIDEVLQERAAFKEAGRGRVSGCEPPAPAQEAAPPGAQLDLAVPPAAARVCVRVTLHGAGAGTPCSPARHPPNTAASCTSYSGRRDSWLSFKSIQDKFSSKRHECGAGGGTEGDAGVGAGGAGARSKPPLCPAKPPCRPPCPRPPPPPPPPEPKHPYPRHPCPPRPSCPSKTSQPPKEKKSGSGCDNKAKYIPLTVIF